MAATEDTNYARDFAGSAPCAARAAAPVAVVHSQLLQLPNAVAGHQRHEQRCICRCWRSSFALQACDCELSCTLHTECWRQEGPRGRSDGLRSACTAETTLTLFVLGNLLMRTEL